MNRIPLIYPDEVVAKHRAIALAYLLQARFWKLGTKQAKVKALRRKLAFLKPKPVPDTGVIYQRAGTKYKVMPNGEWRRQD